METRKENVVEEKSKEVLFFIGTSEEEDNGYDCQSFSSISSEYCSSIHHAIMVPPNSEVSDFDCESMICAATESFSSFHDTSLAPSNSEYCNFNSENILVAPTEHCSPIRYTTLVPPNLEKSEAEGDRAFETECNLLTASEQEFACTNSGSNLECWPTHSYLDQIGIRQNVNSKEAQLKTFPGEQLAENSSESIEKLETFCSGELRHSFDAVTHGEGDDLSVGLTSDEESSEFVPASDVSTTDNGSNSDELVYGYPAKKKKKLRLGALAKKQKKISQHNAQIKRKKAPSRPCLFCSKFIAKLKRHLTTVHGNEEDVKRIMALPETKRQKEFDLLKKKGIYNYNLKMIAEKKPLIPERNQGEGSRRICSNCHGFFSRKYFHKHRKTCHGGFDTDSSAISGICVESLLENDDVKFNDLLSRFQDDEKGNLCRQDHLIKTVGRSQYLKHRKKEEKRGETRKSVMSNMRSLASLFIAFKSCAASKHITVTTECLLQRQYFNFLEEAIQLVAVKDDGTIKPGLMVSIGNLLKIAAKVMKGSYLISQDDAKADNIDKFMSVLTLRWVRNFGDAEYQVLKSRQSKLRQPSRLPDETDLKKIRSYTVDKVQSELADDFSFWNPEKFVTLRNLIISRLTLFNARRGGEPSRLLIGDWLDAKTEKWIDKQRLDDQTSDTDKFLLKNFKVIYQGGKGSTHLVPVLVPPDCVKALDALSDLEIRKICNISAESKFLFPSTRQSKDHASGWHATKEVAVAAGVDTNITATQMRHRAATLYAQLDVPEGQREAFFRHMGHSAQMNRDVYQCPMALQEVTNVGNYLASIDGTSLHGSSQICSENATLRYQAEQTSAECSKTASRQASAENSDSDVGLETSSRLPGFVTAPFAKSTVFPKNKTVRRCLVNLSGPKDSVKQKPTERRYTKWSDGDFERVYSYFCSTIEDVSLVGNKGALPGKKKIQQFFRENPEVLVGTEESEKISLVHSKIFNERNKFRKSYKKRLDDLEN